jgi:MFS-type transporter involved in bile tolerance (Atg22 family)
MGYLGGGLLLAINVVMIFALPGTWGPRLSFLSVAIWWVVFSIPIFRSVPEPMSATERLKPGETVIGVSLKRLVDTFKDMRRYRELFKYLVAFLIYNDAIGTIIGLATIYGAELGFGTVELILALLLVQFVGIPFSLIFGRLPNQAEKRRPLYLSFITFNLIALPIVGIALRLALPADITGDQPPPYAAIGEAVGQGSYDLTSNVVNFSSEWVAETISAELLGTDAPADYWVTSTSGEQIELSFNGQRVEIVHALRPDGGIAQIELDGVPYADGDDLEAGRIDTYGDNVRYGETFEISAPMAGEHTIRITSTSESNSASSGSAITINSLHVLEPARVNSLPIIIALLAAMQGLAALFAFTVGKRLSAGLANTLDTRRSILLALLIYTVIACWGFLLNSTIEFWFLAWMVAIVQGGSQALSRSLYSSMSPAAKSGEFFGLYGIMERFSSIIGPLLFAGAVIVFGSSRPAIISLIVFFVLGGYLLTRVNIAEGQRVAQEEDAAFLGSAV